MFTNFSQPNCFSRRPIIVTATLLFAIALMIASAHAQTFTTLYSFQGVPDGQWPTSAVILDSSGNLYGTTYNGGNSTACPFGCGTIYKMDSNGNESILHNFNKDDGRDVIAGMIIDPAGNFYGTTTAGGTFDNGTIFEFDSSGVLTTLFNLDDSNGADPGGNLLRDSRGNLYGTLSQGRSPSCYSGAIFRFNAVSKNLQYLHCFTGNDGTLPESTLVRDSTGYFYGTTFSGGAFDSGTIFRVDKSGFTTLYNFSRGVDSGPSGTLVLDSRGNLYGSTGGTGILQCAQSGGCGSVFKFDPSGKETVLYVFSGGVDGSGPGAGLLRDGSGTLYGTTTRGGDFDRGTIFRINATGQFKVLHSFTGNAGGSNPSAELVRDSAGNLYGITFAGGSKNVGTVFKLTP